MTTKAEAAAEYNATLPENAPTALAVSMPRISSSEAMPRMMHRQGEYTAYVDCDRYWRDSNVPERHRTKTLERHTATGPWGDCYRRLRDRLSQGPLIVLLGPRGTGKTQLAVDLLADICRTGRPVYYAKMLDLFRELRQCFRKDGPDEVETVNRFRRYGGLILDEAQERGESDFEARTLVNLIDHRYDAMKTTILVSNMTKDAFAEAVGPSIISRIHESGEVVECDWPSFRTPKGNDHD